jgi:hypothetical protein
LGGGGEHPPAPSRTDIRPRRHTEACQRGGPRPRLGASLPRALPGSHPGAQQVAPQLSRTSDGEPKGGNPLCGDHFTVYPELEGDSIRDISFQGWRCAISKASASMMTQRVKGKTRAEAERVFDQFHKLVTGQSSANRNRDDWASWPFIPASPRFLCGSSAQPLPGTPYTLRCKGNKKLCRRSSTRRGEGERTAMR